MSERLWLGIDVGAPALKAVAISDGGAVRGSGSAAYETIVPQPGWAEQRPDDWWRAAEEAISALGRDVALADVAAIGLTGQMHGSVFLDAEREVIRPALLWNDQRTVAESASIEEIVGVERLVDITGSRSSARLTAPKLLWLRRNATIAYKRLHHLLLPKDYVRLRLTGERATDVGDASGTGLFDVGARAWSTEIIDALDVDADVLPSVYEGPEITGFVRDDVAAELGLTAGIPIVAGGGDQQAGAVGAGAVAAAGVAVIDLGTRGVVLATAERYAPDARLQTMCHSVPGTWLTSSHIAGMERAAMDDVAYNVRQILETMRDAGLRADELRMIDGGARGDAWAQIVADVLEQAVAVASSPDGTAIGAALLAATGAGAYASVAEAASACVRVSRVVAPRAATAAAHRDGFARYARLHAAGA